MGLFDSLQNNFKETLNKRDKIPFKEGDVESAIEAVHNIFDDKIEGAYITAVRDGETGVKIKGQIKGISNMDLAQIIVDFAGEHVDPDLYDYVYKSMKKKGNI